MPLFCKTIQTGSLCLDWLFHWDFDSIHFSFSHCFSVCVAVVSNMSKKGDAFFSLPEFRGLTLFSYSKIFWNVCSMPLYNMVLMASSWPFFLTRAVAKSPNMTRFASSEGFVNFDLLPMHSLGGLSYKLGFVFHIQSQIAV